uniref:Uncharacterized protein n=1 Tax=Arundo donax TaxID=35708 RepID=A0A0A8Z3S2_ARUDO
MGLKRLCCFCCILVLLYRSTQAHLLLHRKSI